MIKNNYIKAIILRILLMFVNLLESVFLARYIGASLKGELSYINIVSQILFLIGTLGLSSVYPYLKNKFKNNSTLNNVITINIFLFIIYTLVSILLINFIDNIELKYIVFIFPTLCFNYNITCIYTIENPNSKNLILIILTLFKIIYLIVLILFTKRSLFWAVTTLLFIPILENIIFLIKLKYKFNLKIQTKENLFKLIKIGFIAVFNNILTILFFKLDILMLKNFSNITLSALGIYSIGLALAEKTFFIGDAVKEMLLHDLAKKDNNEKVAKLTRLTFFASIILSILIIILSRFIINLLYGEEYLYATHILNISLIGTGFMVFFILVSQYNLVKAKQYFTNLFLIITIIINFILNIIFIPKYGIIGAAVATTISYICNAIFFIIYFHKETDISYKNIVFITRDDIKDIVKNIRRFYEKK